MQHSNYFENQMRKQFTALLNICFPLDMNHEAFLLTLLKKNQNVLYIYFKHMHCKVREPCKQFFFYKIVKYLLCHTKGFFPNKIKL